MRESVTERLTDLAARPVDAETRKRARLHVADWLACAVLGATSPAGQAILAYGRDRVAAAGPCAILGIGRGAAETAAFVHGGLGNIFEMDDLHRTSIMHPGDVVIPAALATAERAGAGGAALLEGIVRGYEVAIRVGAAAGTEHYAHWYNTATCGVFGAAAAAGSVLGLSGADMADALGQAGMQAAGLWQCRMEPTFSKQLATARAAQSGLIAADLAATGFPGPKAIIEGPHGFFAATCPAADPEAVLAAAGAPWLLHEVSFKPWPACRHAHPVIEACLTLGRQGSGAEPRQVRIRTYRDAVEFCDNPNPATPHEARFSLQHCAAVVFLKGEPGLDDFTPAAIADADTAAFRARVSVETDAEMTAAFPNRYGAGVEIVDAAGAARQAVVTTAKGDPENPMSEAEIEAKFRRLLAVSGVAAAAIDALWRTVQSLPEGPPVAGLCDAIGAMRPAG